MNSGLIIEDVIDAQRWLTKALHDAYGEITVTATATVAAALEAVARESFDVALVDLSLPDGSGVDVIARIKECSPHTFCVVVTIYDDDSHLFPALQAGAQGYLLKDQPHRQIVQRLKRIDSGEPPLSPAIARRLLRHFSLPRTIAQEVSLSNREKEVLTLIAKGLKLSEVAGMLEITHNTAAGYVKDIYRKLNISSRAEAALEAARLGLISSR